MPLSISLQDVADAAGVSLMTASYAMRNDPRTAAKTRVHVQSVAEKLGYRPDPEIGRLMARLRQKRETRYQAGIALLDDLGSIRTEYKTPYQERLISGIQSEASRLGYSTERFPLDEHGEVPSGFLRTVRARNIRGLLLLPRKNPHHLPSLPWNEFVTVSLSRTTGIPVFDRVVPNAFENTQILLDQAIAQGYQRIGFVTSNTMEGWHGPGPSSVYARFRELAQIKIPPHLYTTNELLQQWIKKQRPEVILSLEPRMEFRLRVALKSNIPLFCIEAVPSKIPGIDQRPEWIGKSAVQLLAAALTQDRIGVPETPMVQLVTGVWASR